MNTKPLLFHSAGTTFTAAALAGVISIGLLSSVVLLFQRDGTPFEHLVAAERACATQSFGAQREACLQSHAEASRARVIASR